jgi:hypothetical protein
MVWALASNNFGLDIWNQNYVNTMENMIEFGISESICMIQRYGLVCSTINWK